MILASRSFFEPVIPTERAKNHYFAGVHRHAREWIKLARTQLDQAAAAPGSPSAAR